MAAGKEVYSRNKSVRKLARERVGAVPAAQVMQPKTKKKRPKHKKPLVQEDDGGACANG